MVARKGQFPLDPFADLEDPRSARNRLHPLNSLIFLTISAVICGADNWVEVESFGNLKVEWLSKYVNLPYGIPSHDTLGRVFAHLNSSDFERAFIRWTAQAREKTDGEVIAIDGKTLRNSHDKPKGKSAIHMVSAWASENAMVIGQRKTDAKSNEITAIPALLELLAIEGCLVTIDAMGCQKEIVRRIVAQKGDYLIAVKSNQPSLLEQIEHSFKVLETGQYNEHTIADHGRIETRKCEVISNLKWIEQAEEWPGLEAIAKVTRTRIIKNTEKQTTQTAYYITSAAIPAEVINRAARKHWHVENKLHWTLDVAFAEDLARNRSGHSDENMSIIRRIALNLLKQDKTKKVGIKAKRKVAGWDNAYLQHVLQV